MLTGGRLAAVSLLVMGLLGVGIPPALAGGPGGGVTCPPRDLNCDVTAGNKKPSQDNKRGTAADQPSSGGSGKAYCAISDTEVPCSSDDLGAFNQADKCYWLALDPQPGPADPIWTYAGGVPAGWKAGDAGALYNVVCPGGGPLSGGTYFSETGPAGGGVDVEALAQEAVRRLRLEGADIGIAPGPGGQGGSVGLPVWVWNNLGPSHTGPTSASASAGGVTVTATAAARSVEWDFGDGTSVVCDFPGTHYSASYGLDVPERSRQQCGFAGYQKAGDYQVFAKTTWAVQWEGADRQGDLVTTRDAQTRVHIGEVQVVGS